MLQTNCSELVTHLGFEERDEIIEALQKINEGTGTWKLCLVLDKFSEEIIIPIPTDLIEKVIAIGDTDEGREIYIQDINEYIWDFAEWKVGNQDENLLKNKVTEIKNLIAEHQLDRHDTWKSIRLIENAPNEVKLIGRDDRHTYSYVRISMGDGYCDNNSLTIGCTQHCCTNEFPAFHRIRELFDDAEYHSHDGGTTIDYEQWMNYWFRSERGFTHHWYQGRAGSEGMEVMEDQRDESLEAHPPIVRTTTVDIPDRSRIEAEQRMIDGIFTDKTPLGKKKKIDTKRPLGE